jgi:hypothetical protein
MQRIKNLDAYPSLRGATVYIDTDSGVFYTYTSHGEVAGESLSELSHRVIAAFQNRPAIDFKPGMLVQQQDGWFEAEGTLIGVDDRGQVYIHDGAGEIDTLRSWFRVAQDNQLMRVAIHELNTTRDIVEDQLDRLWRLTGHQHDVDVIDTLFRVALILGPAYHRVLELVERDLEKLDSR